MNPQHHSCYSPYSRRSKVKICNYAVTFTCMDGYLVKTHVAVFAKILSCGKQSRQLARSELCIHSLDIDSSNVTRQSQALHAQDDQLKNGEE